MIKSAEVIIVGAGPSGLTAAKVLASCGIETIVLERYANNGGKSIKNFYSGVVCTKPLKDIFEVFKDGKIAFPIERVVTENRRYLLKDDSFVSLNLHNEVPNQCFNISRKSFNDWMIQEVQKAQVDVIYGKVVRELIVKDKKIIGVKTDEEEFHTNVVVVAEGINSLLTKKTGLRAGELPCDQVFLFVEENINLPSEIIEERLNLNKDQGVAAKIFTNSFLDIESIGYLNTNKNSISLGIGILLSKSISKSININECIEKLKMHPAIKPLIYRGISNGYGSYMLPIKVGGIDKIPLPRIYSSGCLIIGGAALLVNPYDLDISSLAVISGKLAAQTIIQAKEVNNFSTLAQYGKLIKEYLSNFQSLDDFNSLVLQRK